MIPYLVLDIENDTSNRYGRDAGNFLYDQIVAIGWKQSELDVADAFYCFGIDLTGPFRSFLSNTKPDVIIGHNIKHDLLFLWKNQQLQDWLKQGGKIWDTQLVEYILTSFKHKYPALRDIAVNKYGCKERVKLMEEYWEKGVQTSQIPKELVLEDVKKDVLDTEQVFLKQYKEVEEWGLMEVVEINMNLLLATIDIEYNGFKTDRQLLETTQTELEVRIQDLQNQIQEMVKPFWPDNTFNPNSTQQVTTLLMGGTIKTKKQEVEMTKTGKLKTRNREVEEVFCGLDPKFLSVSWYYINKTPTGRIKVDEDFLQHYISVEHIREITTLNAWTQGLKTAIFFCSALLELRKLEKEVSTYYESPKQYIYDCDDCIHANFNHCATDTARLSSNKINMQNLPTKKVSKAKQYFISRF
jgi:DNA polymerase I-like protein with 3'-5' exonuclease and polymerase domains